ncbi:MAG: hypothetical protein V2A79_03685 [Planctomycetota bacterium]
MNARCFVATGVSVLLGVVLLEPLAYANGPSSPSASTLPGPQARDNPPTPAEAQPKPLPAGEGALTWRKCNRKKSAWQQATMAANYEKYGDRSDAWDSRVRTLVVKLADYYFGAADGTPVTGDEIAALSREIIDARCTDPLVFLVRGRTLFDNGEKEEARPYLGNALAGLEASQYPRRYLYHAARCVADLEKSPETVATKMTYLAQAAADTDFRNGNQRHYMELFYQEFDRTGADRLTPEAEETFFREFSRTEAEPWIRLVVTAHQHSRKARRLRDDGRSVGTEAWRVSMSEELRLAREDLVRAHTMHPEFPEAAALMIRVASVSDSRDEAREWFERAVAAHFDYMRAYENMGWVVRAAESYRPAYDFAVECLNTKRFDTVVPDRFPEVVWDLRCNFEDAQDIYTKPGVYENLWSYLQGVLNEPTRASTHIRHKSWFVSIAANAGRYEDARKLLDELGGQVDLVALGGSGGKPQALIGEVRLRTGPFKDEFAKAEALWSADRSLEALPVYQAIYDKTADDPMARFCLDQRLAALRLKEAFLKGEWVGLSPPQDMAGWPAVLGTWEVEPDGTFKGGQADPNKGAWAMLACPLRPGPSYEIEGEMESSRGGALVLKHGWRLNVFASFGMDVRGNGVWLGDGFARWGKSRVDPAWCYSPKVSLGKVNRFRVQIRDSRITAHVNDEPVFYEREVPKDWWDVKGGGLAFTTWNATEPRAVAFRNVRLRRLGPDAPSVAEVPGPALQGDAAKWLDRVVGTYRGSMTSGPGTSPVTTVFTKSADGALTGRYEIAQDGKVVTGKLSDIQATGVATLRCKWQDNFGQGALTLSFTEDAGKFEGTWDVLGAGQGLTWNGAKTESPSRAAAKP